MTMPFIAPVVPVVEPAQPALAPVASVSAVAAGAMGTTSFSHMVSNGLQQVSTQIQTSQADLQSLATGNVENLHQVMLRLEESRMSFQLMLQVRNRLLESYQELMRMQV